MGESRVHSSRREKRHQQGRVRVGWASTRAGGVALSLSREVRAALNGDERVGRL